jgi:hypothetical protein
MRMTVKAPEPNLAMPRLLQVARRRLRAAPGCQDVAFDDVDAIQRRLASDGADATVSAMTAESPEQKPGVPSSADVPGSSDGWAESRLALAKQSKLSDPPIALWSILGSAIAILAASLFELITVVKPSGTLEGLSASGIFSAVLTIALARLVILWRSRLIDEFRDSALDRAASVVEHDRRWTVGENGEWIVSEQQSEKDSSMAAQESANQSWLTRPEILQEISGYKAVLTRLGALSEAREVGSLLQSLRHPELDRHNSILRTLSGFNI